MGIPEIFPNSRLALEAAEFAREQGVHNEFHAAVFRKFYGEGKNIGSWEVLKDVADEIGSNSAEMKTSTDNNIYGPLVSIHTQQAISIGVKGVPVFIFDSKYVVMGLQPWPAFQEVMEQLQKENTLVE